MKIVDVMEKAFQVRTCKNRINFFNKFLNFVPKLLEVVVPQLLQYVHESAPSGFWVLNVPAASLISHVFQATNNFQPARFFFSSNALSIFFKVSNQAKYIFCLTYLVLLSLFSLICTKLFFNCKYGNLSLANMELTCHQQQPYHLMQKNICCVIHVTFFKVLQVDFINVFIIWLTVYFENTQVFYFFIIKTFSHSVTCFHLYMLYIHLPLLTDNDILLSKMW